MTTTKGKIKTIHPTMMGKSGKMFQRVEFTLEDGSWAQTYLVPTFRNFKKWKNILSEGQQLEGLILKDKASVDADSPVKAL